VLLVILGARRWRSKNGIWRVYGVGLVTLRVAARVSPVGQVDRIVRFWRCRWRASVGTVELPFWGGCRGKGTGRADRVLALGFWFGLFFFCLMLWTRKVSI